MGQIQVQDYLNQIAKRLAKINAERSFAEARLLVAHILKTSPESLLVQDRNLPNEEQKQINELVERRLKFEPMAYILGHKEFYGFDFFVNSSVLIPRPETESLVTGVIDWLRSKKISQAKILDLGTGSGCISITLAKILGENFQITALDKSDKALATAALNQKKLSVKNLTLRAGDIFKPESQEQFNIIVSNPPYIPASQIPILQNDIRNFEPMLALDGGEDGLKFLRTILEVWVKSLSRPGLIALETMGPEQIELIKTQVVVEDAKRIWHDGPHVFYEF